MLVDVKRVNNPINIRLEAADREELRQIAKKINAKVSDLARFAIKKHILMAREEFAKNPDFWKE